MIPLNVKRKLLASETGCDVPNVIARWTNTTSRERIPFMAAATHAHAADPSRGRQWLPFALWTIDLDFGHGCLALELSGARLFARPRGRNIRPRAGSRTSGLHGLRRCMVLKRTIAIFYDQGPCTQRNAVHAPNLVPMDRAGCNELACRSVHGIAWRDTTLISRAVLVDLDPHRVLTELPQPCERDRHRRRLHLWRAKKEEENDGRQVAHGSGARVKSRREAASAWTNWQATPGYLLSSPDTCAAISRVFLTNSASRSIPHLLARTMIDHKQSDNS